MNTLSLVREAEKLRGLDEYDQVWCVFDKDDFSIDHFDNAIQRAKNLGMQVAYSNQAFELWYLSYESQDRPTPPPNIPFFGYLGEVGRGPGFFPFQHA